MTALSKYFGGKQLGETIPCFLPNDSRLLPCDGVSERAVDNNNKFLGNIYPRISQATMRQWQSAATPAFQPREIAFGNNMYVAAGCSLANGLINYCMTSSDGRNWITRELPASSLWKSVIWTGAYFLMFGYDDGNTVGTMLRSEDGMNWTQVLNGSYNFVYMYTMDTYSIVTLQNGQSVLSYDGISWTGQNPTIVMNKVVMFKGVLYGRSSGSVYKSDNGIGWELIANITGLLDIETNGTTMVAISSSANQTRYTTDGVTWTPATVGAFRLNVVWNGENFVAFSNTPVDQYRTSPDGVTWTNRTIPTTAYSTLSKLTVPNLVSGEIFIYTGLTIAHMPVITKTWGFDTSTLSANSTILSGIVHTGSRYIAYGRYSPNNYPFIALSTDGVNWTQREVYGNTNAIISDMVINGNICIGVCNVTTTYVYSADGGLSWMTRSFPGNVNRIAFNGTIYLAISTGSANYYTSTDGINWTARTAPAAITGICANGTRFGAACYPGSGSTTYRYSDDGASWTTGTSYGANASEIFAFGSYFMVLLQGNPNIGRMPLTMGAFTQVSLGQSITGTMKYMVSPTTMVVYSDNGGMYSTSTDAATFTARLFQNINQAWIAGTWNSQLSEWLILHSTNGKVTRSSDLLNWTFLLNGFGLTFVANHVYSVKHDTKVICNTGYKNDGDLFFKPMIIPSHNGLNASNSSMLASNGTTVLSAYASSDGSNFTVTIAYSNNGYEWSLANIFQQLMSVSMANPLKVTAIVHDGTYWYIFFNALYYLRSSDAKTWTKYASPFTVIHPNTVTYGNGKLMVIPSKGAVSGSLQVSAGDISYYYTSSDGVNWTKALCPMYRATFVTYGSVAGFMMVDYAATEYRVSIDGITWSEARNYRSGVNSGLSAITGLRYTNGFYSILYASAMIFSLDGFTWSSRTANMTGTALNTTATYVDVDNVLNTESMSASGNTLVVAYNKLNPNVIRAPFIAPSTPPANSYSMIVG